MNLTSIGHDIATASMQADIACNAIANATGKTILALLVSIGDSGQDTPDELNQFLMVSARAAITACHGDLTSGKGKKALDAMTARIRRAMPALQSIRKDDGKPSLYFWAVKGNRHGSMFTSKPPVTVGKPQKNGKTVTASGKSAAIPNPAPKQAGPELAASVLESMPAPLAPMAQIAAWLENGTLSEGQLLALLESRAAGKAAKMARKTAAKAKADTAKTKSARKASNATAIAIAMDKAQADAERRAKAG